MNLIHQFLLFATLIATSFVFFPTVVLSQDGNATDKISISLERKFKRDAARLALRIKVSQNDVVSEPIEIPEKLLGEFYKILSSVYVQNATARALENCNIHTFPDPAIDHLILVYDHSANWTKPFQLEKNKTDNAAFEQLMDTYHLKIENHVKWDDHQSAVAIRSSKPLNMAALAKKFMQIDGIIKTELSIPETNGNDILMSKAINGWELTYLLRFGAHSSGGANEHRWHYQYTEGGEIKYLGESGDPVPDYLRCGL